MLHFNRFRYMLVVLAVGVLSLAFLAPGCSDDPPPSQTYVDSNGGGGEAGTGQDGTPPKKDINKPTPDQTQVQDGPVWPDIWPDSSGWPDWYQPPDQYVSSPFGCTADADCFGQKCCPTPWGVKLCAPTCDVK